MCVLSYALSYKLDEVNKMGTDKTDVVYKVNLSRR
jgi:hypothetical protein